MPFEAGKSRYNSQQYLLLHKLTALRTVGDLGPEWLLAVDGDTFFGRHDFVLTELRPVLLKGYKEEVVLHQVVGHWPAIRRQVAGHRSSDSAENLAVSS